jgi:crotonobetainyl-CoA:carnitine CoA-transferase CaiB-like acyl-CoA transferase
MTETPVRIERRAPIAGEHTEEILHELGLPAERIARLQQEHAVG